MNIGALAATIAATTAARARTELLDAFRVHEATSVDRASSLADLDLTDKSSRLETLLRDGVVRAVDARGRVCDSTHMHIDTARFYLDEGALVAQRASGSKKQAVQIALAILLALALVGFGVSIFGRG